MKCSPPGNVQLWLNELKRQGQECSVHDPVHEFEPQLYQILCVQFVKVRFEQCGIKITTPATSIATLMFEWVNYFPSFNNSPLLVLWHVECMEWWHIYIFQTSSILSLISIWAVEIMEWLIHCLPVHIVHNKHIQFSTPIYNEMTHIVHILSLSIIS